MNTYNELFNKILNEYQTEQKPQNPILNNLLNYLNKSGIDTTNLNQNDLENILTTKEEIQNQQEEEQNKEPQDNNTQQQKTPLSVKPNIVSNIPVNNLNKNIHPYFFSANL